MWNNVNNVQKPWVKIAQQQQRQAMNSMNMNSIPPGQRPAQQARPWNPTPQAAPRSQPGGPQSGTPWQPGGWGKKTNSNGSNFQNEKPLPDGVRVDKNARYLGKVVKYVKWSGYGWIEMLDKNVVPDDTIFVFHRSLKSDDRYPFLVPDMVVELGLHPYGKRSAPGKIFIRAKNVSLPGGKSIAIQDQIDAEKKVFVGGQHLRYTGVLEWFSAQKQFGYVKMDDGFDTGAEAVPKNLKVEKSEVNSGGMEIPNKMKDLPVEFSIWKTRNDEYRVYNMTLPGMQPISQSNLENRKVFRGQEFNGTVHSNMWQQGYGLIKVVSERMTLPPQVQDKMKGDTLYYRNSDIKDNGWLKKGMEVTFQVYIDDKGCGACEVSGPDSEVPL